mmetsp:Transcript_2964/g.4254  ORF Transcript_2964/g.4254 Transcript_2964/m.4254 type:complete len:86 (+) Transcript_2964:282-539(+)
MQILYTFSPCYFLSIHNLFHSINPREAVALASPSVHHTGEGLLVPSPLFLLWLMTLLIRDLTIARTLVILPTDPPRVSETLLDEG